MAFDFIEWSASFSVRWLLWRTARPVGTDHFGNRYFEQKPPRRRRKGGRGGRLRRFVLYAGPADASRVPPEWHGWLHHQTDRLPTEAGPFTQAWVREHVPNLTGTVAAYRPPGSTLRGGHRPRATGDYQPWTPPS